MGTDPQYLSEGRTFNRFGININVNVNVNINLDINSTPHRWSCKIPILPK
jgi:hypothetical protein